MNALRNVRHLLLLTALTVAAAGCAGGADEEARPNESTRVPVLVSLATGTAGSSDLWLVEPDGRLRNLTESSDDELGASWSPDGERIVFVRSYRDEPRIGGTDLFILDVASGTVEELLVDDLDQRSPAWSPDGSRIAFVGEKGIAVAALYTIRPDGTGLRLVGGLGRHPEAPAWSPAGDRIAFRGKSGSDDEGRIHVVDAEGGEETPVSAGPIDREPDWSPRAGEILFIRGFEPRAVDVETGEERSLRAHAVLAAWHDAEGSVLVVRPTADASTENLENELVLLRPDGTLEPIATLPALALSSPRPRPGLR